MSRHAKLLDGSFCVDLRTWKMCKGGKSGSWMWREPKKSRRLVLKGGEPPGGCLEKERDISPAILRFSSKH